MKTLLKTTLIALLLITFSCSKDDSTDTPVIPDATVTAMSPLSGPKTTVVTFTGTNFSTDINAVQVFFDDIEATVQIVTETQIVTTVPPRAFAGVVKIIINGTEFTGFTFEYVIVDINVSTLAGSTQGDADGSGTNAQFSTPYGVAFDASGNIYIADAGNHKIRKISMDGTVTTIAGTGTAGFSDGNGVNASFNFPFGLAIDSAGNIYVADTVNHKIRKITPDGIVSTLAGSTAGFADGNGSNAQFNTPYDVAVDVSNNIYVADTGNTKIRKITPDGTVTTIAGSTPGFADGSSNNAQFSSIGGLELDTSGNIYVADFGNHRIRKINTNGDVITIAGSEQGFADGIGENARFNRPVRVAVDILGIVYVSDTFNDKIRKIDSNGLVSTISGTNEGFQDGIGVNAQFNRPIGLIIDKDFNIYVADASNHKIRKITQE